MATTPSDLSGRLEQVGSNGLATIRLFNIATDRQSGARTRTNFTRTRSTGGLVTVTPILVIERLIGTGELGYS